MDLQKTWITMLVFLLVAVAVWAGFSVYFSTTNLDINPNAPTYTSLLKSKFDMDMLNRITDRVDKLLVTPESFLKLLEEK
jgi:hypothetical protein